MRLARRALSSALASAPAVAAPKELKFEKLSQIDHALARPGMYVGSTALATQTRWTATSLEPLTIERVDVEHVPALVKMFDEVLVNACDNAARDPKGTTRIEASYDGNAFSVLNTGQGIPVVMHETEKILIPHLVFGEMLSGSNFARTDETTGGRHGLGAKVCNVFSSWFKVETCDGKKLFAMEWTANMKHKTVPVVTACTKDNRAPFTRISFTPDWSRFETGALTQGSLQLMQTRVVETAALHPKLAVLWNDKPVFVDFEAYARCVLPPGERLVHANLKKNWEVVVAANADGDGLVHSSFVNAVATMRGGTHVDVVSDLVAEVVRDACVAKLGKSSAVKLSPADVKKHMALFVNCRVANADFEGQTKDALLSKPQDLDAPVKLSETLARAIVNDTQIVDAVLDALKEKADRALRRAGARTKTLGIKKLDDAASAGNKAKAEQCTLILTEGDSAKALAVAGIASLKERDLYGVFPLRGKPLNVRDVGKDTIAKNAEMTSVMAILGLEEGKAYPSDPAVPTGLRYGRVMIMTDQDFDGSHIKGLLINFFHELWPSLVRRPGFLCQFRTPLLKAKRKTEQAWTLEFFSQDEFDAWSAATPDSASAYTVKWYKGLGTSTAAEAKKYFGNLPRHVVDFAPSAVDDDLIDMAFAKARAPDRKTWLSAYCNARSAAASPPVQTQTQTTEQTFGQFISHDLVQYSWHDVERSIPSAVDGLKPSQRKVLHACFQRSAKRNVAEADEVKVVQLAGYVAETTAYHHGEASLHATIVGMAQDFVGSNNAPLLVAAGQFGTRAEGGKDAAAPRYIYTRLHANARLFFPREDDALLDRRVEDGEAVEPVAFVPVIPTVLVNGATGIGTGWSSYVPPHHPGDVASAVASLLASGRAVQRGELKPWFRGFTGPVRVNADSGLITTEGVAAFDNGKLVVSELPVGMWNDEFKAKVETLLGDRASSARVTDKHDGGDRVRFEVQSRALADVFAQERDVVHALKLRTNFHTTNMHLLDAHERIKHYDKVQHIIDDFMPLRLAVYGKRHAAEAQRLERDAVALAREAFAVGLIAQGKVKVLGQSRADVLAALSGHGVDEATARRVVSKPVGDMTVDRVAALEETLERAKQAAVEATKKTPEGRWLADLDRILLAYGTSSAQAG